MPQQQESFTFLQRNDDSLRGRRQLFIILTKFILFPAKMELDQSIIGVCT